MVRRYHLKWLATLIALGLLPILSCSLLTRIAPNATATFPPLPTLTVQLPLMPNDEFVLKLPDESAVNLTVTSCEGAGPGGFLELDAMNTRDKTDPKRVEVQVNGGNNGEGKYDGMYISVIIGTTDKPIFSGNNPNVRISMDDNGSGTFENVEIVNISNTPPYEYGKPYKFDGQWSCKR
jgi:hypothetical protein